MEIKIKSYSKQSSLISAVLFLIFGAILFSNAERVVQALSVIVGIVFAIVGVVSLITFIINNKKGPNFASKTSLISGIICLIFAIIFIFFSSVVEQSIRFILGAWILLTGIMRLIDTISNTKGNKFWSLLIVSILLISVGIYTIVFGDVILSTIGIIMMIYALIEIVGYIIYSKTTSDEEKNGTETLLIPEEEENTTSKKKKRVKKAKTKEIEDKKNK